MQLGIMFPNVLAGELDDIASLAERGIKCIQARPEAFCDDEMKLSHAGKAALEALDGTGIEIAGWCAYKPLIGGPDVVRASVGHIKRVIEFAAEARTITDKATPRVMSESGNPASCPHLTDQERWDEIVAATSEIAALAEKHAVVFAFEPTRANIISGSVAARHIIQDVGSRHVRVCYDAANIVGDRDTLEGSIEGLGELIVLSHAKDVVLDPETGKATYPAAGQGSLDYPRMVELLDAIPTCNQIVIEYVRTPEQAEETIAFLRPLCE